MKAEEFVPWLEGYAAALNGPPDPSQWATILTKLSTVPRLGKTAFDFGKVGPAIASGGEHKWPSDWIVTS